MTPCIVSIISITLLISFTITDGGNRRQCFTCRSRGELGDCRDPFPYNETTGRGRAGLKIVPCPSGWCSKIIEGVRGPPDDFGTATERSCLTQAPPDLEERCAELPRNNKISLLCVCRGDLCNSAKRFYNPLLWMTVAVLVILHTVGRISLELIQENIT